MTTLRQDVDGIIEEEKLDAPVAPEEDNQDPNKEEEAKDDNTESNKDDDAASDNGDTENEGEKSEESDETDASEDAEAEDEEESEDDEESVDLDKEVEEAKTLVNGLIQNGLDVFDDKGNPRDFEEVLPPGKFFLSQLEPVKVTDKDGKQHEFLLLSDVEKKFPDGFEAKNNIEQMKFERNITRNENKFDEAITSYNDAKSRYEDETSQLITSNNQNSALANEYKAMAEEGLVPKVGDPKDPKFTESDAVKELDNILSWMTTKNEELKKKGMGEINSLYVAKQLMDNEDKSEKGEDKKKTIDQQRKKVAKLSNAPNSGNDDKDKKRKLPVNQPMSNYIEQLISEEDIK